MVAAHEIELRCVTPELRDRIPATRETLTSLAVPAERTRFYSRLRTLRIAHGLTEFLRDYAAAIGEPRSIVIDHLDDADQTDQELVSVLLRRIDPEPAHPGHRDQWRRSARPSLGPGVYRAVALRGAGAALAAH